MYIYLYNNSAYIFHRYYEGKMNSDLMGKHDEIKKKKKTYNT